MAKSSQVLSIERREGVSMAEVVMDDMAIGNPASLMTLAVALWASFPGIHIAQIPFQVIGNCGVIFLMQCSNGPGQTPWRDRLAFPARLVWSVDWVFRGNCPQNCPLAGYAI